MRSYDSGPTPERPINGGGAGYAPAEQAQDKTADSRRSGAQDSARISAAAHLGDAVLFSMLRKVDGLIGPKDLTSEAWREYFNPRTGLHYRIDSPVALYYRHGGTTHRVLDRRGVVHCVPCGVDHPETIIRWRNYDITNPVNW